MNFWSVFDDYRAKVEYAVEFLFRKPQPMLVNDLTEILNRRLPELALLRIYGNIKFLA